MKNRLILPPSTALRTSLILMTALLTSCAPVDLNAPIPTFDTGADTSRWVTIPAGEFFSGQHEGDSFDIPYDYEMMVYLVTTTQYSEFLTAARADGKVVLTENAILGYYPGDEFHNGRHEERIDAGNWLLMPLGDPALRIDFTSKISFGPDAGYENHPMTMVSWFGAWAFCNYFGWRLPTEMEWVKAARGEDQRPFPWGGHIERDNANYYASRDPFEDMSTFGSRTSPVGFYNGQTYGDYVTIDSPSPYGLYDMAGNVWQWTGDVYEQQHYRYMRGGSKDTYDMDLRIWVRNNATPTYYSPGAGFRCAR